MFKIADIIKILEEFAPRETAASYDNPGLKIGNIESNLTGVLVTVDTNTDVVAEAKAKNCNLIIEHHPSIWRPLKNIDINVPLNKALIECVKNDIALYSAHTNIDFAVGGLNDYVAAKLGLDNIHTVAGPDSARIGDIAETTLKDYCKVASATFNDDNAISVGRLDKQIRKVAIVNGAGGSEDILWQTYLAGADVLITSEVKYNVTRLAKDLDYAIIQIGHYESEVAFMPLIKSVIDSKLPQIPVFYAESMTSTYNRRSEIWN